MKIVYISNAIIPSRQANSVHIMKMCSAFARNGHDVSLICPDSLSMEELVAGDIYNYYGVPANFEILKINCISVFQSVLSNMNFKNKILLYPYLAIKKALYPLLASAKASSLAPDIVFSRYLPGVFWLSSQRGVSIVYENHNFYNEFPLFSKLLFRRMVGKPSFKRLLVISRPLLNDYTRKMPFLEGKIIVAPDGADPVGESEQVKTGGDFAFNAGYAGHLYPGRGMEIIADLAKALPNMGFHIIGGSEKDIRYWKEKCSSSGNLFFYGFLPPSDVNKYLKNMDVLLAPYQRKVGTSAGIDTSDRMSPLKIFEYMAVGKTMILSDIPVLHEVVEHNITGIFADPENVDEWKNNLLRLKENPFLRESIAVAARNKFIENYTWGKRAETAIRNI